MSYALIGKHGDVTRMGLVIVSQPNVDDPTVMDEDDKTFPSLDAAIQHRAQHRVAITPVPWMRVSNPPTHARWAGPEGRVRARD